MSTPLVTAEELAAELSVCAPTVMKFYRRGIIPAEVAAGRVYRFDAAKCRAALAEDAARKAPKKNLPPAAGTAEGLSTK